MQREPIYYRSKLSIQADKPGQIYRNVISKLKFEWQHIVKTRINFGHYMHEPLTVEM